MRHINTHNFTLEITWMISARFILIPALRRELHYHTTYIMILGCEGRWVPKLEIGVIRS